MSQNGAIRIKISDLNGAKYRSIVSALLEYGWSYNDHGRISYMINGTYDWSSANLNEFDDVFEWISLSAENDQPASVSLTWRDTNVGGDFMFINHQELMFSLTINSQRSEVDNLIDFSWYLHRMTPVLETFEFVEIECIYD